VLAQSGERVHPDDREDACEPEDDAVAGDDNPVPLLRAAAHELQAAGKIRLQSYALATLCAAYVVAGDMPSARLAGIQALPIAMKTQHRLGVDHIALLASRSGNFSHAARLLGFADAMYQPGHHRRLWPEAWSEEQAVGTIEDELGLDELPRLRAAGSRLTREEAEACARAVLAEPSAEQRLIWRKDTGASAGRKWVRNTAMRCNQPAYRSFP
jgi:hypothetical protein